MGSRAPRAHGPELSHRGLYETVTPTSSARVPVVYLLFPQQEADVPTDEQLTIRQTPTGYWSVQRGAVHVVGAPTRSGAEAERELLRRLSASRPSRRGGAPQLHERGTQVSY